jgi:hypothetical protein
MPGGYRAIAAIKWTSLGFFFALSRLAEFTLHVSMLTAIRIIFSGIAWVSQRETWSAVYALQRGPSMPVFAGSTITSE